MDVFGICWVSNYVPGIDNKKINHEDILKLGDTAGLKIKEIVEYVFSKNIF
jgi:purine nucleoside phosphorylase